MRTGFLMGGTAGAPGVLRRRIVILLVCVLTVPGLVYALSARQPKTYEARVILEAKSTPSSRLFGTVFVPDAESGALAMSQFGTSEVIQAAAAQLRRPYSSIGAPRGELDARTGWLTLVAAARSADSAVTIANAFASALRERLSQVEREGVESAIAELRRSRDAVGDPDSREQLDATLDQLRAEQLSDPTILPVVERADEAEVVSPHPSRDATLAMVLALLLAPGLVVAAERLDTRIRRTGRLADIADAPVLTTVPVTASVRSPSSAPATEAVARLRDKLVHVQRHATLDVVAVASGLPREGCTTVAVELALAYARAGKRVVLLDADLRGGDIARRLGIAPAPGLTDVLHGSALDQALRPAGPADAALLVLPAGSEMPNAGALLGSERMSLVLEQATRQSDVVVIDTAPLLKVSDALALLRQASGVVTVARLGWSRRDAVDRLTRLVRSAGGHVLGVVATGAPHRNWSGARSSDRTNLRHLQKISARERGA